MKNVKNLAKDVNIGKLKENVNKIDMESIKSMPNKKKAIIGGALLVVVGLLFSGGGNAVSIEDIKKPFPVNGSVESQCEAAVDADYNFRKSVYDKSESLEDLKSAYKEVLEGRAKASSKLESIYWSAMSGASHSLESSYNSDRQSKEPKEEKREKSYNKCVSQFKG